MCLYLLQRLQHIRNCKLQHSQPNQELEKHLPNCPHLIITILNDCLKLITVTNIYSNKGVLIMSIRVCTGYTKLWEYVHDTHGAGKSGLVNRDIVSIVACLKYYCNELSVIKYQFKQYVIDLIYCTSYSSYIMYYNISIATM